MPNSSARFSFITPSAAAGSEVSVARATGGSERTSFLPLSLVRPAAPAMAAVSTTPSMVTPVDRLMLTMTRLFRPASIFGAGTAIVLSVEILF
jgi:hypothetical protein